MARLGQLGQLGPVNQITINKREGTLPQQPLPRRDFHKVSNSATPVSRNPSMRREDARKDVPFHQFIYRTNPDKTIDAICAFCYMTAATAQTHAELRLQECAHRCPRG